MTPDELSRQLAGFPQLLSIQTPSPLEPLPQLTQKLNGPQIWIKRDDELGPGLGGNKGRKLAFIMAEVQSQNKRKVITYGGLQSNHARMTAAACAALGLEAHLFFFAKRPFPLTGNLLLNDLLGAKMHFIPFGSGGDASMTLETTNRLVRILATLRVGPGAYFMPVGGHSVTGCLGYVAAALEIHNQSAALNLPLDKITILTAVGTGGTLAGLLAGLQLLNSPINVLGLDIGKLWKAFPSSLARLTNSLHEVIGSVGHNQAQTMPLIEKTYAGPAYAHPTAQTKVAIKLLAQSEGILLDPVYTGKAFAGLLDLVANGRFSPNDILIFLHTGGLPGLWAYPDLFDFQD